MPKIFISYRRDDARGHARHLFGRLADRYGKKSVFMDLETIKGGERFVERIDEEVARCDAFLALIGKGWVDAVSDSGERRLDQPEDYVRREIAAALKGNINTIPVLLDGATMPQPEELPDEISALTSRNAVALTSARWDYDLERLMGLLPPPTRRWVVRSVTIIAATLLLLVGAVGLQRFVWPEPTPMSGTFNVAVVDFGEKPADSTAVRSSTEGKWIAAEIFEGLQGIESESSTAARISVSRFEQRLKARNQEDLAVTLAEFADQIQATIIVHGVLDLDGPPYLFTPIIYLTQQFNGGEELTGESQFGHSIEVSLPLDGTGQGTENRLKLTEQLRSRVEALQHFTLGLAYLQIDQADVALELFGLANEVEGLDAAQEVLALFRGSALVELERFAEAREAYETALSLTDGAYGRALIGLGNLHFEQGRVDRAANLYQEAMEADQNSPTAHVEAKARFNLGLALATQARKLGESCSSEEADRILEAVIANYDAANDVDVLKELAFKSHYQRGLLDQACAHSDEMTPPLVIARFEEAAGHYHAALDLGEPTPVGGRSWFNFGASESTEKLAQRPWQRDRWVVWHNLGYAQLRMAELGNRDLYPDAITSFEQVTSQFERAKGDVPRQIAAEAYEYLGRALEPSDPAAAESAWKKAREIAAM